MAPKDFPEEVDVFTIPHSRMKSLVDRYFDKLQMTNFADDGHLIDLLQVLDNTFAEFKIHEHIEDTFIMRRLRSKLKEKSVRNKAVCNCHKDNRLNEMLDLVKDGYKCTWKSQADRINYGIKLRTALEEFTKTFIPHMQEEEEVFQPLLMKYFTYEELILIKNKVIVEHERKERDYAGREQLQQDKEYDSSCESDTDDDEADAAVSVDEETVTVPATPTSILQLPPEVTLRIMSHLSPRDLCTCAQVCRDWSEVAMTPSLWREISPVKWARGDWRFSCSDDNDVDDLDDDENDDTDDETDENPWMMDEDLDVDEDADKDESSDKDEDMDCDASSGSAVRNMQRELRILLGITKHLLPRVGTMVKRLNLAHSKALTNAVLTKMLYHCPNLESLDLSQTRVSDTVFKALNTDSGCRLRKLVLSGCVNITDSTLIRLAKALDTPPLPQLHDDKVEESPITAAPPSNNQSDNSDCLCKQNTAYQLSVNKCEKNLKNDNMNLNVNNCCGKNARPVETTQSDSFNMQAVRRGLLYSVDSHMITAHPGGQIADTECRDRSQKDIVTVSSSGNCHQGCAASVCAQNIEGCADVVVRKSQSGTEHAGDGLAPVKTESCGAPHEHKRSLQHLNLSGCFQITDVGLRALSENGGLPSLEFVDFSGCWALSGDALSQFVSSCPQLWGEQLYYCDNIMEGPYASTAGGCQNLGCDSRYCCRLGQ